MRSSDVLVAVLVGVWLVGMLTILAGGEGF